MRGRPSVVMRASQVETVLAKRCRYHRPRYDFSAFTDHELEALLPLAAKRAAAAPDEPDWTLEEVAVLQKLAGKLATTPGNTGCA